MEIPFWLEILDEGFKDNLPPAEAHSWPAQFEEALAVCKNPELSWPKFILWILSDPVFGVQIFAQENEARIFIRLVTDIYRDWAEKFLPDTSRALKPIEALATMRIPRPTMKEWWAVETAKRAFEAWAHWGTPPCQQGILDWADRAPRDAWMARPTLEARIKYVIAQRDAMLHILRTS